MALLSPTRIGTQHFTWVPDKSLFVAEDSSLPRPSRVWDDACDEGYTLVSERTGEELVIALEHVERSEDGIAHWDYQPIAATFHNRFIVRVFND
jgi:hypothetical protein